MTNGLPFGGVDLVDFGDEIKRGCFAHPVLPGVRHRPLCNIMLAQELLSAGAGRSARAHVAPIQLFLHGSSIHQVLIML
jgi:hypothetical protein